MFFELSQTRTDSSWVKWESCLIKNTPIKLFYTYNVELKHKGDIIVSVMHVTCWSQVSFCPRWTVPTLRAETLTPLILLSGCLTNSNRWRAPVAKTQHLSWALCQTFMCLPALWGPSHLATPPLTGNVLLCSLGCIRWILLCESIIFMGRE